MELKRKIQRKEQRLSSWNEIKDQLTSNKNLVANLQYANDLNASLLASSRIFALIVRHRDLLFDTIEERKTNELNMYRNLQSFTASLQSIFPRLSGIAIGGATLPVLISQAYSFFYPDNPPLPTALTTLLVAGFGAIGYIIAEIGSSRTANKKMIQTTKKYDDQKENVYKDFLAKSRRALEYLLDDLILTYKQNIDTNYQITDQQKKEIINDCIADLQCQLSKCNWTHEIN